MAMKNQQTMRTTGISRMIFTQMGIMGISSMMIWWSLVQGGAAVR